MTSPAGYQRLTARRPRRADAMWVWMAARPDRSFTAAELAEAAGVSEHYAQRYCRLLRQAGILREESPARGPGQGPFRPARYRLARRIPEGTRSPIMIRTSRDPEPTGVRMVPTDPAMSHEEFRSARARLGLTLRQMAAALGYRDPRAVRRFETAPGRSTHRPVPPHIADRVRELLAEAARKNSP